MAREPYGEIFARRGRAISNLAAHTRPVSGTATTARLREGEIERGGSFMHI